MHLKERMNPKRGQRQGKNVLLFGLLVLCNSALKAVASARDPKETMPEIQGPFFLRTKEIQCTCVLATH